MNRTKGQASLEFLMTYGWAIVVIAVVLVAIWQWGVFNPQGKIKATTMGFWGVAPLDFQYKTNGDITLSLQNTITDGDINITEINITISDKEKHPYKPDISSRPRIESGKTILLGPSELGFQLPSGRPGESFNLQVIIEYVDDRVGEDTKFRSSGTIQGTIESTV